MKVLLAGLVVLCLTPALSLWALRRGWIDRRDGGEAQRKPRTAPVPPVGGVTIVAAVILFGLLGQGSLPWMGLLIALGVGVLDDLRGLGAGPKACCHLLIGLVVALEAQAGGAVGWLVPGIGCATVIAINGLNTWDHADGLAGGCGLLGLASSHPVGAAACAGFLPWNTVLRRSAAPGPVPVAYLGDGGSHALAVLLAWFPAAWPALLVPLLDLARVVVLRLRAGQSPFAGDRRHFGQRLEHAGLGPPSAAVVAALCIAPSAVLPAFFGLSVGLGLSMALYLCALALSRPSSCSESL